MKNFLNNNLGKLGLAIYYVIAFIIRIPVAFVLAFFVIILLLIWGPLTGKDDYKWLNELYNWYCGD